MNGLYTIAHEPKGQRSRRRPHAAAVMLGLLGCGVVASDSSAAHDLSPDEAALETRSAAAAQMALSGHDPGRGSGVATDPVADQVARREARRAPEPVESTPHAPEAEEVRPIATRIARQTLQVRVAPDQRSALRGRIPMGEAFAVFARVDGEDRGCGEPGWAEVGGGYVCLERTRPANRKTPKTLPRMRDHGRLPFYYAKVRKGRVAQQWHSVEAYRAGKPSVRTLEDEHDYAFVARKISKGELFLVDERQRVVPAQQLSQFYPSAFSGVDLLEEPAPAGTTIAWNVRWPHAPLRTEASSASEVARELDYHERLSINPEPVDGGWYRLTDGSGYVHRADIQRWTTPATLESAAAGEIWIDVDLEQQTLTVMRGKVPVFATLISSGFKAPTPRGIFRIRLKQAIGTMTSNPGDRDTYAVEEVPHVQYFFKSFALHSAYWHNRFGHKMSHGCVNLAPNDARTVYEMTGPHPRGGWLDAYESEADLGTTVRIHDGDEQVRDRRGPVEPVAG